MKIRYESGYDIILYGGAPSWFPLGFPVTEVNQMPVFPRLTSQSIPKKLCSFDQKSRITNSQVTALHFYVTDSKFRNVLTSPEKYLSGFMQVGALLTPDITISKEMAQWARIRNTHLSRCLGAYFLARHFEVIPSLRWSEVSDLDFVLEGIPKNSIFSVGAYGSYRDKELRDTLEQGLVQAVARLKPQAIMIYGRLDKNFGNKIAKMTTVANFEHPLSKEPKSIPVQSESDLFVA